MTCKKSFLARIWLLVLCSAGLVFGCKDKECDGSCTPEISSVAPSVSSAKKTPPLQAVSPELQPVMDHLVLLSQQNQFLVQALTDLRGRVSEIDAKVESNARSARLALPPVMEEKVVRKNSVASQSSSDASLASLTTDRSAVDSEEEGGDETFFGSFIRSVSELPVVPSASLQKPASLLSSRGRKIGCGVRRPMGRVARTDGMGSGDSPEPSTGELKERTPGSPCPVGSAHTASPGTFGELQNGSKSATVVFEDEDLFVFVGLLSGSSQTSRLLDGREIPVSMALQLTCALHPDRSDNTAVAWSGVSEDLEDKGKLVLTLFKFVAIKRRLLAPTCSQRTWYNEGPPYQTVYWPHVNISWDALADRETLDTVKSKLSSDEFRGILNGFFAYLVRDESDASEDTGDSVNIYYQLLFEINANPGFLPTVWTAFKTECSGLFVV